VRSPAPALQPRRALDRALPGQLVDLIRDGVSGQALKAQGDRAVWKALFRTAASACQRGWDAWEWEEMVLHPSSRLGAQVQMRRGRGLSEARVRKIIYEAWDQATAWVNAQPPPFDRQQMADGAERAAARAELKLQDPDTACWTPTAGCSPMPVPRPGGGA
jgi:hypothetical protein